MAEPTEGPATVGADIEEARGSHTREKSASEKAGSLPNDPEYSFERIKKIEVEKVLVLSFRTLQLKRIAELQDELVLMTFGSASQLAPDKDMVDRTLGKYAEALRNYETLSQHALSSVPENAKLVGILGGPEISFQTNGRLSTWLCNFAIAADGIFRYLAHGQKLEFKFISYTNETSLSSAAIEYLERFGGKLGFRELDQKGREERSKKNAFTQRIIMAMFGGAALVGPMLIMTLHPSKNTSLITVSVATFLFALVLALIARDSAGKDVLGATAAYAAVLVVFVGTSMAPTS